MALIDDDMPCALCGKPIHSDQEMFCTTAWGCRYRRFQLLEDTASHQECIDQWALRDEFIEYYNRNCGIELYLDGNGRVAYRPRWHDIEQYIALAIGVPFLPMLVLANYYEDPKWMIAIKVVAPLVLVIAIIYVSSFSLTLAFSLLAGALAWVAMIIGSVAYIHWGPPS
jgi:hypothetical protein